MGLMSPLFRLEIRGRGDVKESSTKTKESDPEYNEEFSFDIVSYNSDTLRIIMYNAGVGIPAKVSRLDIQVAGLPPGQIVDQWYPLQLPEWGSAGTAEGRFSTGKKLFNVSFDHGQQSLGKIHLGLQVVA
jgi:hypothetical protein